MHILNKITGGDHAGQETTTRWPDADTTAQTESTDATSVQDYSTDASTMFGTDWDSGTAADVTDDQVS